jgi:hypothetical protein
MFTTSRSIDEITYIIDTTLTDLVKLKHRFISEESKLNWIVGTSDVDDTLNKLKEVSELLDDPLLVQNYSHYLKRAKERIDSFNDDTSYYQQLLAHSEDLTKLIEELNSQMGLQRSGQTPVSSLIDKICSFIELFHCYWNEDLYKHFQQFESLFCNMSLHKTTTFYGQVIYTDPTVQLAYLSFIHSRITIQDSYLSGFIINAYIGSLPYNMPVPWDQRLYDIYGIIKPSWCI